MENNGRSPEKENQLPQQIHQRIVTKDTRPTTPQPTLIATKSQAKETLSEVKDRMSFNKAQYESGKNIVIATGEGSSPYFKKVVLSERKDQRIRDLEQEVQELREIIEITNRDKNIALKFNQLLLEKLDGRGTFGHQQVFAAMN